MGFGSGSSFSKSSRRKPRALRRESSTSAADASSDTTMRAAKRARLESKGWRLGGARELLSLSEQEALFIEIKLALSRELKELRVRRRLSQAELATQVRSSQSRVAKMEAGDPSVSIDLLVRSLLALGASREELAQSIKRAA